MDKKSHLLEVAEELFAEFGFEGTSIRMLAAKAEVNVAMVSYYFGSKEKLFEELVREKTAYMREQLQLLNQQDGDAWEKFEVLIGLYVERIISNHRFHRLFLRELSLPQRSALSDTISALMMQSTREMERLIQAGISSGRFKSVDVPMTIATLVGTISKITNSHKLSCMLMHEDPETSSIYDDKFKNRIKDHLKTLFKAHLINQQI